MTAREGHNDPAHQGNGPREPRTMRHEAWTADVLAARIRAMLAALDDETAYPADGICSHRGVYCRVGPFDAGITAQGRVPLLTLYAWRPAGAGTGQRGLGTLAWTAARRVSHVVDSWNDERDGPGGSYVLQRPAPAALARAVAAYRALPDVFCLSSEEKERFVDFQRAYDGALRRALAAAKLGDTPARRSSRGPPPPRSRPRRRPKTTPRGQSGRRAFRPRAASSSSHDGER